MVKKVTRRVKKGKPQQVKPQQVSTICERAFSSDLTIWLGSVFQKAKAAEYAASPRSLMSLPTELIEDICEILNVNRRLKSLAVLNATNKRLRDITTQYLWESVTWTPKHWKSWRGHDKRLLELGSHIKYITKPRCEIYGLNLPVPGSSCSSRPYPQLMATTMVGDTATKFSGGP